MTAPVRAEAPKGNGKGGSVAGSNLAVRLKERAREIMEGFSSGQKAVLGVAVLAVLVGGYLFMSWAGKPSYVPLFSNLSSSDAAAITQKLSANKVPYELAEGGEQVLVPETDVNQQRLDMAAAGLPSTGSQGYSLLDTAGVTTSEFQQQVEYQQAVSDELEQTIESITGVQSAEVSVVIPQQSLFATTNDQPSASVLVSLQPGASLTAEQVQAIVHLVASSIEDLSPGQVTVVDQNGDVLSAPGTDSGEVAAGTMDQQATQTYEQNLDDSLQDMLATVLGPGNAVVQTNAQLDFDQTQISSQIYNPNNQAPIAVSQATSKESYTGSNASQLASGVLGATTLPVSSSPSGASASPPVTTAANTANVAAAPSKTTKTGTKTGTRSGSPGGATTTTAAGTGAGATTTTAPSYTSVGESQQNVVSEVTKTVNSAPGALERLTIAVAVNDSVKGVSSAEITKLVSEAAGLETARGDSIQVAFVPFDNTAAKQQQAQLKAAASASSKAAMMGEVRDVLVVLVVLGLLLFALRRITKTTRVPLALPAGYQPLELEAGAYQGDSDATMALPVASHDGAGYPLAPAAVHAEVSQIGQMIEQEPDRIAEMLRAWLESSAADR
ncbi:MAG TPA: flagellar basal-body MS-ring/collar protein FliF [Acidimicrobiales bacterium]|nr:flagellar basal-body MS-ring/collar protein FliF [Acidimicrobiales bacterium]